MTKPREADLSKARRKPRGLRGVTLIEVTVAAALLGVGVTGIISSWASTVGVIEHQRRFSDGTNLARAQLERLLLLPPDTADLAPGTHTIPNTDAFGNAASGPSSYATSYVVAGDTPAEGFVEVTVTVSWPEGNGTTRSTSFNTYRER